MKNGCLDGHVVVGCLHGHASQPFQVAVFSDLLGARHGIHLDPRLQNPFCMRRFRSGLARVSMVLTMRRIAVREWLGRGWVALLLAVFYVAIARPALLLDAVSGFATLVWPPAGISLAAIVILGPRLWPGVALGAFVTNLWVGAPPLVALGIAFGNALEAVLGAWLLRRAMGRQAVFDRLRHVFTLVGPVALASTAASATIGVGSLCLGGIVPSARLVETWRAWWLGDALGDLVVGALAIVWMRAPRPRLELWRQLELVALLVGVGLAGSVVFLAVDPNVAPIFGQAYIVFPLLIIAALRFGLHGAVSATFVVAAVAICGTALGLGPFVADSLGQRLLSLQAFMGIAATTMLVLGGTSVERACAIRNRDDILAAVSHDLGNPLSAIRLSVQDLLRVSDGGLNSTRLLRRLETIHRSVQRMEHLSADLLDAAALDAGQLALTLREQDAAALIFESIELHRLAAATKQQQLVAGVFTEPIVVTCDRNRILQILGNLVGNSIKFTPAGGTIALQLEMGTATARFSVVDTGAGILPDRLPHIFERYWRADPVARQGVGLGLYIARRLVEAQGGRIWVESTPDQGSAFHFTLPLARRLDPGGRSATCLVPNPESSS